MRIDLNRYRDTCFAQASQRHPYPEGIFLLIEVSGSTLKYDRTQKAEAYAKANTPEYWILNLKQHTNILLPHNV